MSMADIDTIVHSDAMEFTLLYFLKLDGDWIAKQETFLAIQMKIFTEHLKNALRIAVN